MDGPWGSGSERSFWQPFWRAWVNALEDRIDIQRTIQTWVFCCCFFFYWLACKTVISYDLISKKKQADVNLGYYCQSRLGVREYMVTVTLHYLHWRINVVIIRGRASTRPIDVPTSYPIIFIHGIMAVGFTIRING